MTDLQDLIARVEAGEEASFALFRDCWKALVGPLWEDDGYVDFHEAASHACYLDACMVLQERCLDRSLVMDVSAQTGPSYWKVYLGFLGEQYRYQPKPSEGSTFALAWLLAILKADQAEKSDG